MSVRLGFPVKWHQDDVSAVQTTCEEGEHNGSFVIVVQSTQPPHHNIDLVKTDKFDLVEFICH